MAADEIDDDKRRELIEKLGVCTNPNCRAHDRLLQAVVDLIEDEVNSVWCDWASRN